MGGRETDNISTKSMSGLLTVAEILRRRSIGAASLRQSWSLLQCLHSVHTAGASEKKRCRVSGLKRGARLTRRRTCATLSRATRDVLITLSLQRIAGGQGGVA